MVSVSKQQELLFKVVKLVLETNDRRVIEIGLAEKVVSSVLRTYFDACLDPVTGAFEDSAEAKNRIENELCYLNFIKRVLVSLESHPYTQVLIMNEAAQYFQELSIRVDQAGYEEANRAVLNVHML